jgi:EmrB/QacA subfamily drug resistance transporter
LSVRFPGAWPRFRRKSSTVTPRPRANNGAVSENAENGRARSPWTAFGVLSIAVFLAILDLFIVNIAFPDIRRSFSSASLANLSWILSGYAIVFAAVLVPAGKLADIIGRKRVFLAGLLIFLTGSALCAAAPSVGFLIGARVLQAVGGAALTPTSLGLILPLFQPQNRQTVIGLWAAIAGVGAAAGPPIGGLLVEVSWRWIFLINLPLGLFAVLGTVRIIPEIRPAQRGPFPDVLGSLLLTSAVGLLTLGLVKGPEWSWDSRSLGAFAASVVALLLFTYRSAHHPAPVVELPLLRPLPFALSSLSALLFFAAFAVLLLGNVLFLTDVWRYTVTRAGFAFFPGPLVAAVVAGLSGRLGGRLGSARVGAPGGVIFACASLWFLFQLGDQPRYLATYLPGQLLGGAGIGLMLPAFTALAVSTLPPARLVTGIAVQTAIRQIGAAVGLASFVAIVGTSTLATKSDFDGTWLFMAVASAASGLVLLPLFGRPRSTNSLPMPAAAPAESATQARP